MEFAGLYLVNRLLFRIYLFFHHWYIHGSKQIIYWVISRFESLDKSFAFKITLTHFFEPLYGDYTVVGRFFGVVFRTFRLFIGAIVYLALAVIFLAILLTWWMIPGLILLLALYSFKKS